MCLYTGQSTLKILQTRCGGCPCFQVRKSLRTWSVKPLFISEMNFRVRIDFHTGDVSHVFSITIRIPHKEQPGGMVHKDLLQAAFSLVHARIRTMVTSRAPLPRNPALGTRRFYRDVNQSDNSRYVDVKQPTGTLSKSLINKLIPYKHSKAPHI